MIFVIQISPGWQKKQGADHTHMLFQYGMYNSKRGVRIPKSPMERSREHRYVVRPPPGVVRPSPTRGLITQQNQTLLGETPSL